MVEAPKINTAEAKEAAAKRMAAAKDAIWDPVNKTLLGRSAASWGRILGFYLIYYTLLLLLFLFTIQCIEWRISGNEPDSIKQGSFRPVINTRLDEPGLVVYPHNAIWADNHNKDLEVYLQKNAEDRLSKDMIASEKATIRAYKDRVLTPNKKCNAKSSLYSYSENLRTEKMPRNHKYADEKVLKAQLRVYTPTFFLKLNKIVDWQPVTIRKASSTLRKQIVGTKNQYRFSSDVVYFTCAGETRNVEKDDGSYDVVETVEGSNVKKIVFHNPKTKENEEGLREGGCAHITSNDVGCIPKSWYTGNKFQSESAFTERKDKKRDDTSPGVPSCWPFIAATAVPKDIEKPMRVSCQVHLANVNAELNNPHNYGWTTFGFKPVVDVAPKD